MKNKTLRYLTSFILFLAIFIGLANFSFAEEAVSADSSVGSSNSAVSSPVNSDLSTSNSTSTGNSSTNTVSKPEKPGLIDTVDNRSEGIVINLFDYTPYDGDPYSKDYKYNDSKKEGINTPDSDHAGGRFQFVRDYGEKGRINFGSNQFGSAGANIRQGTVLYKLGEDGYPVLNLPEGYSLSYLFDPDKEVAGRVATYTDVSGLFERAPEGYFFDSSKNYAYFNKDKNQFEVYEGTYSGLRDDKTNGTNNGKIGFFPFDEYDLTNNNVRMYKEYVDPNASLPEGERKGLNHHFGLTLSTKFIIPNEEKTFNGNPMKFEFSGDDDIWVFIDGYLVLDIGGTRKSASGYIDFSTGEVKIDKSYHADVLGNYTLGISKYKYQDGKTTIGSESTLKDIFEKWGAKWDDSVGSTHELKLFYLERGDTESNLSINHFNIPTVKNIGVEKLWKGDSESSRPKNITVKLLADGKPAKTYKEGKEIEYTLDLNAENGWKGAFENLVINRLDEDSNKIVPIKYTVEEVKVNNYETSIVSGENSFTITNTKIPDVYIPNGGSGGGSENPENQDNPNNPDTEKPTVPKTPDNTEESSNTEDNSNSGDSTEQNNTSNDKPNVVDNTQSENLTTGSTKGKGILNTTTKKSVSKKLPETGDNYIVVPFILLVLSGFILVRHRKLG